MADDLTVIPHIAAGRAKVLAEELGVASFADLAEQDVDSIVEALHGHPAGRGVGRDTAAMWIAEAQRRAARPDGWTLTTLFLVLYERRADERRTIVRHVDAAQDEQWAGYVTDEPAAWIGERLAHAAEAEPEVEAADEDTDDGPGEVARVARVRQPPDAADDHPVDEHGNVARPLSAGEPFTVAVEIVSETPHESVTDDTVTDGVADTVDEDPSVEEVADVALGITAFGQSEPTLVVRPAEQHPDGASTAASVDGLAPGLYHVHPADASTGEQRRCPLILVE
jgi:hypothetical protein